MRKSYLILCIIFSVFVGLSFINRFNEEKKNLTIEEALKNNMISTKVRSLGGHTGECIELEIKSNLDYDTTFYLEPGRRFVSMDSTIQDIIIVKENEFMLAAGQEITLNGYGFCCQASNGSPYSDAKYSNGNMEDSLLIALANHLNENDYTNSAMQGAVWVVSDKKPLSAIYDSDKEEATKIRELQKFVAVLAGISLDYTWYSIKYKTDTARLFSGIHDVLAGEVDYEIYHNSEVSLVMYDSTGRVLHQFFQHKKQGPGEYTYPVEFYVSEWPKGNYYIRLFADGQMKLEKIFNL